MDMMKEVERVEEPAPNEWDGFNIWTSVPEKGFSKLGRIGYKSCSGGINRDPVVARRDLLSNLKPKQGMDFYLYNKDVLKSPR